MRFINFIKSLLLPESSLYHSTCIYCRVLISLHCLFSNQRLSLLERVVNTGVYGNYIKIQVISCS